MNPTVTPAQTDIITTTSVDKLARIRAFKYTGTGRCWRHDFILKSSYVAFLRYLRRTDCWCENFLKQRKGSFFLITELKISWYLWKVLYVKLFRNFELLSQLWFSLNRKRVKSWAGNIRGSAYEIVKGDKSIMDGTAPHSRNAESDGEFRLVS